MDNLALQQWAEECLTITWDVFECYIGIYDASDNSRLTITWDVFESVMSSRRLPRKSV